MSNVTYVARDNASSSSIDFLGYVQPDLSAIESRLKSEITSEVQQVYALSGHTLNAGGKRLRPAMVSLSARCIQPDLSEKDLEIVGAAVELVHMATLVHDDVVDDTATRRGKPTANAVFGNGVAVLSGDFLLARAMRLLCDYGEIEIIRTVSEITIEMSEGEILEIIATGNPKISQENYYDILHKKTAVFVEGCCKCGAMVAGASHEQTESLAEYGRRLGLAFQIADDLLDYTGDPLITGKPLASDLKDGRATLPFLLAMESAKQDEREVLLAAFGNAQISNDTVLNVVKIMECYGVFDTTRAVAREHVELAEKALLKLPPSIARECFAALTDYVVQRDR